MINSKTSLKLHLFSGFHDPVLTDRFGAALHDKYAKLAIADLPQFEITTYPMHSLWTPIREVEPIHLFIGFSAGVIRAAIAAHTASLQNIPIAGLIAIDGWGVPLCDRSFPIYRFSHDVFTHLTSPLLGSPGLFFADPPVDHLALWAQPNAVNGWFFDHPDEPTQLTASAALLLTIRSLVAQTNSP